MSTEYTSRDHRMRTLFSILSKYIEENDIASLKSTIDTNLLDLSQIKNSKKNTLLHVAAKYNREAIAAYLIEKGLSIHEQNSRNECPYYVAVLRNSKKVQKYMEERSL